VDGNFHHRHSITAGDSPHFYESQYILSKDFVDAIGHRINGVRKARPKKYKPMVPDEAVDNCEKTHEAADEHKQKTNMDHFDDTGMMALVCRHDIPIFLANIDTPGEEQKYAVALLEHLFSLLPAQATVAVLYDVGCVLDRSLNLVSAIFLMYLLNNEALASTTSFRRPSPSDCYLRQAQCTHMDINGRANSSIIHASVRDLV